MPSSTGTTTSFIPRIYFTKATWWITSRCTGKGKVHCRRAKCSRNCWKWSLSKILHCCLTFCLLILLLEIVFKPYATSATERIFFTWCPSYKTTSYLTILVFRIFTNALNWVSGRGGGQGGLMNGEWFFVLHLLKLIWTNLYAASEIIVQITFFLNLISYQTYTYIKNYLFCLHLW